MVLVADTEPPVAEILPVPVDEAEDEPEEEA